MKHARNFRILYPMLLTVTFIFQSSLVRAVDADNHAYEIAKKSIMSDDGFHDSRVDVKMIMRDAKGREIDRTIEFSVLESTDASKGDKSLIIFDTPADVEGTALLSHSNIVGDDLQWIYLPAMKRVKRIASANKAGAFVGSEFAFEDFTSRDLDKYSYHYLREEACGGRVCDVISQTPKYTGTGYSELISWIDRTDSQLRKIEFYNRAGKHFKTLTFDDYTLYRDKFWRARKMSMVNQMTSKETDLVYGDFKFGTGLSERDFNESALARVR